jgi:hypothetical protein
MRQLSLQIVLFAALSSAVWVSPVRAEMGPCRPGDFDFICGSGVGAARAIAKTISPSERLAFAWRLPNKPPTGRPEDSDLIENLVVRLKDGTPLAKSHGAYWDLGTKIAKAYLLTAWSPDSRLLVKVEQRADSASAELFSFGESDATIGPFDLVNVIKPAVEEKEHNTRDPSNSVLVFTAHPAMTIDDQGLMHAVVFTRTQDASNGQPYDVTVQTTRKADSLDATVIAVAPYSEAIISIIVH